MRYFWAITWGGLTAGALDILSAFATFIPKGATLTGILKFIASGLAGSGALKGGVMMAALGLGVHFGLTTLMAALYVAMAKRLPVLLTRPWICGIVYGLIVYVAMTYLIVPVSAVSGWKPAEGWAIVSGLLAHCLFVGAPIAHIASYFLSEPRR